MSTETHDFYHCEDCDRSVNGEKSTDPLLPPAIVCEHCGHVLIENDCEPDYDQEGKDL